MKKTLLPLALLCTALVTVQAEEQATVVCKHNPEVTREHFNNTMHTVTKKIEGKVSANDLQALEEKVLNAIQSLKKSAKHPCKDYSDGSASWGSRMTMDYAKVVAVNASVSDTSFLTQIALVAYPLWHNLVHTETQTLKNDAVWKYLPSNWSDLGIATVVYLISKKKPEWTKTQILEYIVAAIYAKGALAIAVERLGLVEEKTA